MSSSFIFFASGAILVLFVVFVIYEHTHPISRYRAYRAVVDRALHIVVHRIMQKVRELENALSPKNIVRSVVRVTAHTTAIAARSIERKAHHITRSMTHHDTSRGSVGTRSAFLQQVQEHKKNLNTDEVKRFHRLS